MHGSDYIRRIEYHGTNFAAYIGERDPSFLGGGPDVQCDCSIFRIDRIGCSGDAFICADSICIRWIQNCLVCPGVSAICRLISFFRDFADHWRSPGGASHPQPPPFLAPGLVLFGREPNYLARRYLVSMLDESKAYIHTRGDIHIHLVMWWLYLSWGLNRSLQLSSFKRPFKIVQNDVTDRQNSWSSLLPISLI